MLVRSLKRTMGFEFGGHLHIVRHDHHQVAVPDELRDDPHFQFALKHGEVAIIESQPVEAPAEPEPEQIAEPGVEDATAAEEKSPEATADEAGSPDPEASETAIEPKPESEQPSNPKNKRDRKAGK